MGYLSERYNYPKGLADGLELNKDSKEGKVIIAMLELLDDMVLTIEDLKIQGMKSMRCLTRLMRIWRTWKMRYMVRKMIVTV